MVHGWRDRAANRSAARRPRAGDAPIPANAFATDGLVELLATGDSGGMLAVERAFSIGVGNNVRLYEIRLHPQWRPGVSTTPVNKRAILDFGTLRITLDTLEAMNASLIAVFCRGRRPVAGRREGHYFVAPLGPFVRGHQHP